MYKKHLKKFNIDFGKIKNKIKDIIIKSVISLYHNLTSELFKNKLNDFNFYNVLGYDIIITKDYEPYLLELNSGPSMISYNELDKPIKVNLIVDTLNIIGILPYTTINFSNNFNNSFIEIEENVNNAICELYRPRGDYDLIFPLKENINKYKFFFKNINNKENQLFWKLIQEEK